MTEHANEVAQAIADLNKMPPYNAVMSFFVSRINAIDARLAALYKIMRAQKKSSSSNEQLELPEPTSEEQANRRALILNAQASVIEKRGDIQSRSPAVKEFYALYLDLQLHMAIIPRLGELKPRGEEKSDLKQQEDKSGLLSEEASIQDTPSDDSDTAGGSSEVKETSSEAEQLEVPEQQQQQQPEETCSVDETARAETADETNAEQQPAAAAQQPTTTAAKPPPRRRSSRLGAKKT